MVTHDPRATEWVDLVFHLEKGVLRETFPGGAGRRHGEHPPPVREPA